MKKILSALTALVLVIALLAGSACAQGYSSYDDIFNQHMIFHFPQIFIMMDRSAYAGVTEDGIVDCIEYGVEGDTICEWVETIYFPLAGVTQEEYATMQDRLHSIYDVIDAEFFASVSYEYLTTYYKMTLKITDLDNPNYVHRLTELGLLTEYIDIISMSLTEQNLLAQGYLKDPDSTY